MSEKRDAPARSATQIKRWVLAAIKRVGEMPRSDMLFVVELMNMKITPEEAEAAINELIEVELVKEIQATDEVGNHMLTKVLVPVARDVVAEKIDGAGNGIFMTFRSWN